MSCIVRSSLGHFDFFGFLSSLGGSVLASWGTVKLGAGLIIEYSGQISMKDETKERLDKLENELQAYQSNASNTIDQNVPSDQVDQTNQTDQNIAEP